MEFRTQERITKKIVLDILLNGENIGTVEYAEDTKWHTIIAIRDGDGILLKLAQGFGYSKEEAIKNTIEQNISRTKECVTQLELLKLSMYGSEGV